MANGLIVGAMVDDEDGDGFDDNDLVVSHDLMNDEDDDNDDRLLVAALAAAVAVGVVGTVAVAVVVKS